MRGKIIHPARFRQIKDLSGLRWGKITPTDIDVSVDFGGRHFVFGEIKCEGAEMGTGQRLHLEALCRAIDGRGGNRAMAWVAEHRHPVEDEIDVARAMVVRMWISGGWTVPPIRITVMAAYAHARREWGIPACHRHPERDSHGATGGV